MLLFTSCNKTPDLSYNFIIPNICPYLAHYLLLDYFAKSAGWTVYFQNVATGIFLLDRNQLSNGRPDSLHSMNTVPGSQ